MNHPFADTSFPHSLSFSLFISSNTSFFSLYTVLWFRYFRDGCPPQIYIFHMEYRWRAALCTSFRSFRWLWEKRRTVGRKYKSWNDNFQFCFDILRWFLVFYLLIDSSCLVIQFAHLTNAQIIIRVPLLLFTVLLISIEVLKQRVAPVNNN